VGEGGPELFIPDNAGTILPNGIFGQGRSNGGDTTIVNQTFQSGVTRRELANIKGEWKAETIAATNLEKNKGGNFRRKMS
jgi:predicted oxidoreductase